MLSSVREMIMLPSVREMMLPSVREMMMLPSVREMRLLSRNVTLRREMRLLSRTQDDEAAYLETYDGLQGMLEIPARAVLCDWGSIRNHSLSALSTMTTTRAS